MSGGSLLLSQPSLTTPRDDPKRIGNFIATNAENAKAPKYYELSKDDLLEQVEEEGAGARDSAVGSRATHTVHHASSGYRERSGSGRPGGGGGGDGEGSSAGGEGAGRMKKAIAPEVRSLSLYFYLFLSL